jgi:hypothetical protein
MEIKKRIAMKLNSQVGVIFAKCQVELSTKIIEVLTVEAKRSIRK